MKMDVQCSVTETKGTNSRSQRHHGGNRNARMKKETGELTSKDTVPSTKRSSAKATYPWINGQILAAAETGNFNHFIVTVDTYLPQMNFVNLTTALHRLAKMATNDYHARSAVQGLLPKLLTALKDELHRCTLGGAAPKTQALSNVAWALATMQLPDIQLIEILVTVAHWKLAEFKHFELSTLLWALAKIGSLDHTVTKFSLPIFMSSAEYICAYANQFTFRGLVMVAWAFATARLHDARIFHAIGVELFPHLHTANSQELANTAWSFSTAGVHKERIFNKIGDEAILRLHEFKPQELSSILWSFAAIGANHDVFFEAAAEAVHGINLQAQQLANILWALTRARARHPSTQKAVLALLPRCTVLLRTFKPQELASVALAAAKSFGLQRDEIDGTVFIDAHLKLPPQVSEFFFAALPLVAFDLTNFSGQSIANIASSYLSVQIGLDTELFTSVGCEAMIRADKIENSALLLLLKTLPYAPRSAPVLGAIRILFSEAARRLHCFQPREIQTLIRICGSHDGNLHDGSEMMQLSDLHSQCLRLAGSGVVGQLREVDSPRSATFQARLTTKGHGTSELDLWSAPMTVEVANLGRPSSAWDTQATQNLRECVESALSRRDSVREDMESMVRDGSDSPVKAQLPHFVFSVKNTFLDVAQAGESDGSSDSDEPPPLPPLPPALSIIPSSVSPEKLAAYRADYARFRVGNAIGAKGEICTTSV